MEKVNCLILNTVENDPQTVWEIISVVGSKYSTETKDDVLDLVYDSLAFLMRHHLVLAYQGHDFLGDEQEIKDFVITKEFIHAHKDDWKNLGYNGVDYRFFITTAGLEVLLKCLPEYFK